MTCPVSLFVWAEDVSVPRAFGSTAHHLFKVVENVLIFPLEIWIAFCILLSLLTKPASSHDLLSSCSYHGLLVFWAYSCGLAIFLLV